MIFTPIIELIYYSKDTQTRIQLVNTKRSSRIIKYTMKFEANIPSYLRTGQGVFPVRAKGTPKAQKETNFIKLMDRKNRGVIKGDGDNR